MTTTTNGTTYSIAEAPCANGGDRAFPFTATTSGAMTNGDVVNLLKIPAGYKPTLLLLVTDKGVASGTGTIKIGTNDGTTNDDDSVLASTAATSAIAKVFYQPATPTVAAAVSTMYATLGSASGEASDITISGVLFCSPFLA
jgi:hypothetical protein